MIESFRSQMSLRHWRIGLRYALLQGLFVGIIGWGVDLTAKQLVIVTMVSVAQNGLSYLQKHPVTETVSDTVLFKKTDNDKIKMP